jgi:hypothetical protein
MNYIKDLETKGFKIEFEKNCQDAEGYDLYLRIRKDDSYYESFFSMSNSRGYYFTSDYKNDCSKDGCSWSFDDDKLICEYLGVDELKEI